MRQDRGTLQKNMESHNTHGWIISALLREMAGLEGQAMFEFVESIFFFSRCLRQGSVEASRLWQKMATQLLANVEQNVGILWEFGPAKGTSNLQFHVGRQLLDCVPLQNFFWNRCYGHLIEEAEQWDLAPKPASRWWTSTIRPFRTISGFWN